MNLLGMQEMQFDYKGVLTVTAATVCWRDSAAKHGQALARVAHHLPDEGPGDGDGLQGETQNGKVPDFEILCPT